MKHEEITMQTKKAFAASLKKLMEKKPLSKITVSEIAQDCDVNRKTFYYHFEDIYDLLQWMLEQEAVEVVKQFDLMVDYEEAITFVLDYVGENRHILNCAYDSMGRDKLKDFFFRDFIDIMRSLLGSVEHLSRPDLPQFLAAFACPGGKRRRGSRCKSICLMSQRCHGFCYRRTEEETVWHWEVKDMRKRIYEVIESSNGHDCISTVYDFFMMATILISIIPLAF